MPTFKYRDPADGTYKRLGTVGPQGPAGPTGPAGPGGPLDVLTDVDVAASTAGQVLTKMPNGTWMGRPVDALPDGTTDDGLLVWDETAGEWVPDDGAGVDVASALTVHKYVSIRTTFRDTPSAPANGDIWLSGNKIMLQSGGQTYDITRIALDSLTDVIAPSDTPPGKVLGTTAAGQWEPVDPPSGLPSASGISEGSVLSLRMGAPSWQPKKARLFVVPLSANAARTINHNFSDRMVDIRVYDAAYKEVSAEIVLVDPNNASVTVSEPGTYSITVHCPGYVT